MDTINRTFMDRTGWGPGSWDGEPDKVQWRDEATGLPCMVRRSPAFGAWCGYVAIPAAHPWRADGAPGYDDLDVDVHGGLTFAGFCDGDEETGICHVPGPDDEDPAYWIGFDCGHGFDVFPAALAREHALDPINRAIEGVVMGFAHALEDDRGLRAEYRTLDYVRAECANVARQITEAA